MADECPGYCSDLYLRTKFDTYNPIPPPCPHPILTKQVTAGDATFSDGGFHGTDGRWEDIRLLEDLRQQRAVKGTEGCGIILLRSFIQLQHSELIPSRLSIPVLVLRQEGKTLFSWAAQNATV